VRLVALVESADHICCRYRVSAFRPAFARAGFTLDVTPLPRSWAACLRLFRSLRTADAVLLQRLLPPPYLTAALRRHARFLIYDFDDAVWMRDSYASKGFVSRKRSTRFRAVVEASDHVVAGNRYLAGRVSEVPVTIIPTCVDPAQYRVAAHSNSGVTLAWVGSRSTLRGLERFRPTLEEIGRAVPGARLRVISDASLSLNHLPVEYVPWSVAGEAAALASADVGIAWVPDDPWSRGKCGLKVVQYQAAGLPVVANPVGVQAKLVRNGRTGYLATSTDEWVAAVRRLATDPALRRRLGMAGREQVEAAYSVAAGGEAWAEVLASVRPALAAAG
jgi:glycosyltransferase involved in cell wall biosynthesis